MTKSIILSLVFTVLFSASLLLVSFYLMNSWDFLSNCYEFILLAPDLQPNIGLFWYVIFTYFFGLRETNFRRLFQDYLLTVFFTFSSIACRYFFAEVFKEFQVFFTIVFQYLVFIYTLPLTYVFRYLSKVSFNI